MTRHHATVPFIAVFLLFARLAAGAASDGLSVPQGFSVSLFADDNLAHDIHSMTIDSQGRIVVAGQGYVKTLIDRDSDGQADQAVLFSDWPKSGGHGMVFDGHDLIVTGDKGVWRIPDRDGDGRADGPAERWTVLGHAEHGANGIARGPDGCYYIACGNDAGIGPEHAVTPHSPIKFPRCGGIVRLAADGRWSDVFADGFRNPYDLSFGSLGQLLTVDSDGERDHHLPWYAPTRLFDVGQGREHGWLSSGWQRSWNRPPWVLDSAARLSEMGRGSPTGMVTYQHRAFPDRYRDGVFSACWTFGRVYYHRLIENGSTFRAETETFLQSTGTSGFAPVDLAVGPTGELYVAIGGRGTRGGIFRVQWDEAVASEAAEDSRVVDPLIEVLDAVQPLSSWSRSQWVPAARKLGADAVVAAAARTDLTWRQRVRAVEILVDLFDGISADAARRAAAAAPHPLTARLAWAVARSARPHAVERLPAELLLAEWTGHGDPRVRRAAWEALATWEEPLHDKPTPEWAGGLSDQDRHIRWAAILAARGTARASWHSWRQRDIQRNDRQILADLWIEHVAPFEVPENVRQFSNRAAGVLANSADAEVRLEAVRLLQIALGDMTKRDELPEVFAGYSAAEIDRTEADLRQHIAHVAAAAFPSGDAQLDWELARLLAMLDASDASLPERIADHWTETSDPSADVHYLIVMARLAAPRSATVTRSTAAVLCRLHAKLDVMGAVPSRNWPLRVAELYGSLLERDATLGQAMVNDASFGHPDHCLFVEGLAESERTAAAESLLKRAVRSADPERAWTPELVRCVGRLPSERVLPVLRGLWDDPRLRDAVARVLASRGLLEDQPRLVEALGSPQPDVVQRAAEALRGMPSPEDPAALVEVLLALRRFAVSQPASAAETTIRDALWRLLATWSGRELAIPDGKADPLSGGPSPWIAPWLEWLEQQHAEQAAAAVRELLAGPGAARPWPERLAAVDWQRGDASRGRAVFERKACHQCHTGSRRLGPELAGITRRMSRDDLLASIYDPNRSVAPAYATATIVTHEGQIHTGLPIYESPDSTLLQTGAETTVRITGEQVAARYASGTSLMPGGLLDDLADGDLADLYAYLIAEF